MLSRSLELRIPARMDEFADDRLLVLPKCPGMCKELLAELGLSWPLVRFRNRTLAREVQGEGVT